MVRKKVIFLAAAAILLLGVAAGTTMAAYQAETSTDKTISTSSVDVKLNIEGAGVDADGNVILDTQDIRGGVVEERVHAVNAGNKAVYVRVRITKAWYSGDEKIFTNNGRDVESGAINMNFINPQDWIIPSDFYDLNHENVYIYYKKVLKAGESTSDLMDSFTLLKNINGNTNQYAGLSAKIRFDADSIQTTAAKDAMLGEWGVIVDFDENGSMISITNQ